MNDTISPTPLGTGYLVVQVTTANTAIPLPGAAVRISRAEPDTFEILYDLVSGADGRTVRVPLSAPARSTSLSPNGGKAYAAYSIEVSSPGYTSAVYSQVPVFDGITAIQQANLTPLPEAGYTDDFTLNAPRPFDAEIDFGL